MADETIRTHVVFPKDLMKAVDRLVGPRNRGDYNVIVVGTGLAGASAAATLAGITPGTRTTPGRASVPSGMKRVPYTGSCATSRRWTGAAIR